MQYADIVCSSRLLAVLQHLSIASAASLPCPAGMDWLASLYCNTMNIIHFMHDKYNYERLQMSLHDTYVRRLLAFGISGLSVVADSLSAIKYAKVTPVFDDKGLAVDFKVRAAYVYLCMKRCMGVCSGVYCCWYVRIVADWIIQQLSLLPKLDFGMTDAET